MIFKLKQSVFITAFLTVSSLTLVAQKNPIFKGGSGDGYARAGTSTSSTSASIYKGGSGDGWAYSKYVPTTATASNIYKGGSGDGWAFKTYLPSQNSNTVSKGGPGDGWSYQKSNTPLTSNIYKGGLGDGWARQDILPSPLGTDIITFVEDSPILLDEYTAKDVQIYPVPAQNTVNLKIIGSAFKNDSYTVKILNNSGCVVWSEKGGVNGFDSQIDISNLSSGRYFVQVYSSTESYVKPLLIVR